GVEEAVGADVADVRIRLRLRDQMLGSAEADLQPHLVDAGKERAQIGRRRLRRVDADLRQQRVEQRRLPRLERVALAAAEEGALRPFLVITGPPRSDVTR